MVLRVFDSLATSHLKDIPPFFPPYVLGLLWHGGIANRRTLLFPHVQPGSEGKLMPWGHPSTSKWRSLRILTLEVLLNTPPRQKEFPLIRKKQLPLPKHLDKALTEADALQSIAFFSSKSTTTQLFFCQEQKLGSCLSIAWTKIQDLMLWQRDLEPVQIHCWIPWRLSTMMVHTKWGGDARTA